MFLEIKEKRPIRHGSLILLGILIFLVGEPLALKQTVDVLRHAQQSLLPLLQAIATMASTLIALLLVVHLCCSSFEHEGEKMAGPLAGLLWLKAYWHRNVAGFEIWCYYLPDPPLPPHVIYLREHWRDPEIQKGFAIILPLGGWFNRPRIICSQSYCPNDIPANEMLAEWRVKLVAIHEATKVVIVRLEDRYGDRVSTSAENALQILNEFVARLKGLSGDWGAILSRYIIDVECGTRKLAELQAKLDELAVRWNQLANDDIQLENEFSDFIETSIGLLDQSKRFIQSKQAQAIREWFVAELNRRHLPLHDPQREVRIPPPKLSGKSKGKAAA
ncbi:MAG: hypothetical protein WC762_13735 [Methylobacter sp.]|jgi:hypothetical protein